MGILFLVLGIAATFVKLDFFFMDREIAKDAMRKPCIDNRSPEKIIEGLSKAWLKGYEDAIKNIDDRLKPDDKTLFY